MEFNLFLLFGFLLLLAIIVYCIMPKSTENSQSTLETQETQETQIEEQDMEFDRNYEKVKYKNGTVKIPRLLENEVLDPNVKDIICIGRKSNPERVRAIKVGDKLMFPSYGSEFKWKISDDGKYVIISDKTLIKSVNIDLSKAVFTGYQCWGSYGNGYDVTDQSFAYHLSEYMQFIK